MNVLKSLLADTDFPVNVQACPSIVNGFYYTLELIVSSRTLPESSDAQTANVKQNDYPKISCLLVAVFESNN